MNKLFMSGRLVKDPELLYGSQTNKPWCKFVIAVDRATKERTADFFEVIAFDKKAEAICHYFKKGMPILFMGYLEQNKYQTKDGKQMSEVRLRLTDFEFMGSKADNEAAANVGNVDRPAERKRSDEFMDIPSGDFGLPFN